MFNCIVCNKQFTRAQDLKTHISKTKHEQIVQIVSEVVLDQVNIPSVYEIISYSTQESSEYEPNNEFDDEIDEDTNDSDPVYYTVKRRPNKFEMTTQTE